MRTTNQQRCLLSVERGLTDSSSVKEFDDFHFAVEQKLWSLNYLARQIQSLQPRRTRAVARLNHKKMVTSRSDIDEFRLYANLFLDCFLMNAMAVLDAFAHEVNLIYGLKRRTDKQVYITTVRSGLSKEHPNSSLASYLSTELVKRWFFSFATYRHCTTHESLLIGNIIGHYAVPSLKETIYVPLPDDPRNRPFTYCSKRELKSYVNAVKEHICEVVRISYGRIIQDVSAAGGKVPIL